MSVVTISRGSYSHGKDVAEALAAELKYECISREILVEASDQFNIPEIKVLKAMHDAPTVFDRFNHGQERYISFFKSSFLSHIAQGNIVYHGLAGHFFLQGISHVLKVRIIAGIDDRVREEMKRENCSWEDGLYTIKKDDDERRRWSLRLHGKDTWDCRLYDMVLCVDSLTVDDVVEILAKAVRKKQFQETAESIAELKKRAMVARIEAKFAPVAPRTKVRIVDESTIELSNMGGWLKSEHEARKNLEKQVKEEFGIQDVLFKEPVRPSKDHVNTFYNLDV